MAGCGKYIVRAIHDFETSQNNEISFVKDDFLLVESSVDKNWYQGRHLVSGQIGLFPSNFVYKIDNSIKDRSANYYFAVQNFQTYEKGDLDLRKGDIIRIINKVDNNWLEGECEDGRRGIFPCSFGLPLPNISSDLDANQFQNGSKARMVETLIARFPDELSLNKDSIVDIISDIDNDYYKARDSDGNIGIVPKRFVSFIACSTVATSNAVNTISDGLSTKQFERPASNQILTDNRPLQAVDEVKPYARVKYKFVAECKGELSLNEGDIVHLRLHVDDEWTEGELHGKIGIFPTAFVDIIVDCFPASMDVSGDSGYDSASQLITGNSVLDSFSSNDVYTVLYDFYGNEPGDLLSRAGDEVNIKAKVGEWLHATNLITGSSGLIPANFVSNTSKCDSAELNKKSANSDISSIVNSKRLSNSVGYKANHFSNTTVSKPLQVVDKTYNGELANSKPSNVNTFVQIPQLFALTEQKKAPPPRPDIPPMLKPSVTEPIIVDQTKINNERDACRKRLFVELVHTEKMYLDDMKIYFNCFHSNKLIESFPPNINAKLFLNSLENVYHISETLLKSFTNEKEKQFAEQKIGACFLQLIDEFAMIYTNYCQHLEEVLTAIDKNDSCLQKVVSGCLNAIRCQTTCVDINSVLTRPIQRILKYPIFLSELLKQTASSHPDYICLRDAIKQMAEVAHSIDEIKRRRDLVLKYRNSADANVVDRFSRLSLHSVRKKSSRLNMRLSSQIGLVISPKDPEFEKLLLNYKAATKAAHNQMRLLQTSCDQVQHAISQLQSVSDSSLSCSGRQFSTNLHRFQPITCRIAVQHTQKFFQDAQQSVRKPLTELIHNFLGPDNLIKKRYDKLLDLNAAKERLQKNNDNLKTKSLEDEFRRATADYSALHSQLLVELPQLTTKTKQLLSTLNIIYARARRDLSSSIRKELMELQQDLGGIAVSSNSTDLMESFVDSVTFLGEAAPQSQSITRGFSFRLKSAGSSGIPAKTELIVFPQRPQTEPDRKSICEKYKHNSFYVALVDYKARAQLELNVKQGDFMAVLAEKDPMGDSSRWYVDNGVMKGFVPRSILSKSTAYSSTDDSDQRLNVARPLINTHSSSAVEIVPKQPSKHHSRPHSLPKNANFDTQMQLINLNDDGLSAGHSRRSYTDYLCGLDFKQQPLQMQTVPLFITNSPKSLSSLPMTTRSTQMQTLTQSVHYQNMSVVSDDYSKSRNALNETQVNWSSSRQSSGATVERPSITVPVPQSLALPSRPAPSPPVQRQTDNLPGQKNSPEYEFFMADFEFCGTGENELPCAEGQLVCVLSKSDLNGNADWWLCQNEEGSQGFIPSNYLVPFPQP